MFDIGWSELLIIAVVAIVVVGPKDLPRLMRTLGHYAGKLRRAASDFQHQFDESMREAELDEVRTTIESVQAEMPAPGAIIDKPIMVAKPKAPQKAKNPAGPKRTAKRTRKRAGSKAKSSAKRAKTGRAGRS